VTHNLENHSTIIISFKKVIAFKVQLKALGLL